LDKLCEQFDKYYQPFTYGKPREENEYRRYNNTYEAGVTNAIHKGWKEHIVPSLELCCDADRPDNNLMAVFPILCDYLMPPPVRAFWFNKKSQKVIASTYGGIEEETPGDPVIQISLCCSTINYYVHECSCTASRYGQLRQTSSFL